MELWDAYDKNLKRIKGTSLIRGKPIPSGMYHLVCDIIVKHTDGTWLLMQRDTCKTYGGMWEATAGGSALRGETPLQCAVRELWEETGIRADRLTEVGRVKSRDTIYVEHLCVTDCGKDCVRLQAGETVAWRWVNVRELISMSRSELITERMQGFIRELQS